MRTRRFPSLLMQSLLSCVGAMSIAATEADAASGVLKLTNATPKAGSSVDIRCYRAFGYGGLVCDTLSGGVATCDTPVNEQTYCRGPANTSAFCENLIGNQYGGIVCTSQDPLAVTCQSRWGYINEVGTSGSYAECTWVGSGNNTNLTVTPASVDFGIVGSRSSIDSVHEFYNGGTTTATVTSWSAPGIGTMSGRINWSDTRTTCIRSPGSPYDLVLNSGQRCNAVVSIPFILAFAGAPDEPELVTTQLSANATGAAFQLSGTARLVREPRLQLLPASLDFGYIPVGQSRQLSVQVTNTGYLPTYVASVVGRYVPDIYSYYESSPHYRILPTSTCEVQAALSAGQSCSLDIVYEPLSADAHPVDLFVARSFGDDYFCSFNWECAWQNNSVAVSGSAIPNTFNLALSAPSLTFPSTPIYEQAVAQTIRVTNQDTQPTAFVIDLSSLDFFIATTNCDGAGLAASASCDISIGFSPQSVGQLMTALRLLATTANGPVTAAQAQISGEGASALFGELTYIPSTLFLGNVPIGTTGPGVPVTVKNSGTGDLVLSSFETSSSTFVITSNNCPIVLAAQATCTVTLAYEPTAEGSQTGQLIATLATTEQVLLPISAVGTVSAPEKRQALLTLRFLDPITNLPIASVKKGQRVTAEYVLLAGPEGGLPMGEVSISGTTGYSTKECTVTYDSSSPRTQRCTFEPGSGFYRATSAIARYAGSEIYNPTTATAPLKFDAPAPIFQVWFDKPAIQLGDTAVARVKLNDDAWSGFVSVEAAGEGCTFTYYKSTNVNEIVRDSCSFVPKTEGKQTFKFRFTGNQLYGPAEATAELTVGSASGSLRLTLTPNSAPLGATINMSAVSNSAAEIKIFDDANQVVCSGIGPSFICLPFKAAAAGTRIYTARQIVGKKADGVTDVIETDSKVLIVSKAKPNIAVTVFPTQSKPGDPVEVDVELTSTQGRPSGTIEVVAADSSCTIQLPRSRCTAKPFTPLDLKVRAVYLGDFNFESVAVDADLKVSKGAPKITLTASKDILDVRQEVTFTTRIVAGTGTVTFKDGATVICKDVAIAGGAANCATSALVAGKHFITAEYSGDVRYSAGKSSVLEIEVRNPLQSVQVSLSSNRITFGQSVIASAQFNGPAITAGEIVVGEGSSSCVIKFPATSCPLKPTRAGTRTFTARPSLAGGFTCAAKENALIVDRAPSATSITSVTTSVKIGEQTAIEVQVAPSGSTTITPTGTVLIKATTGAQSASCIATLSPIANNKAAGRCVVPFSSVATWTTTAEYLGDGDYQGSTSTAKGIQATAPDTVRIVTISGGGQTTATSTIFAQPLKVRVLDTTGKPAKNMTVKFANVTNAQALSFFAGTDVTAKTDTLRIQTDEFGDATINVAASDKEGALVVKAELMSSADDKATPLGEVQFTLNVRLASDNTLRWDFLNVALGQRGDSKTITFRNITSNSITLATPSLPITGVDATDFGIVSITSSCVAGRLMKPNDSCTITADFKPTKLGPLNAVLELKSLETTAPLVRITLTGQGVCSVLGNIDSDCDGAPDAVELNEQMNPLKADNDMTTKTRHFVMQMYREFAQREADANGAAYYVNQITSGAKTREDMVLDFVGSPEYSSSFGALLRLYQAYFDRLPDMDGYLYWVGRTKATPLPQISAEFYGSSEFQAKINQSNINTSVDFVRYAYRTVYGREADSGGLNYWVNQLSAGSISRDGLMLAFAQAPEYVARSYPEVLVYSGYVNLFRVQPDAAGFAYWVGEVKKPNGPKAFVKEFLKNDSFLNRFKTNPALK